LSGALRPFTACSVPSTAQAGLTRVPHPPVLDLCPVRRIVGGTGRGGWTSCCTSSGVCGPGFGADATVVPSTISMISTTLAGFGLCMSPGRMGICPSDGCEEHPWRAQLRTTWRGGWGWFPSGRRVVGPPRAHHPLLEGRLLREGERQPACTDGRRDPPWGAGLLVATARRTFGTSTSRNGSAPSQATRMPSSTSRTTSASVMPARSASGCADSLFMPP
jgi:hypothetical protein